MCGLEELVWCNCTLLSPVRFPLLGIVALCG